MKLSADNQANFPKLTHYLRHDFPLLIGNGVITSNLRRFGSLSLSQARSALLWDTDPLVVITDLDKANAVCQMLLVAPVILRKSKLMMTSRQNLSKTLTLIFGSPNL